MTDEEKIAKLNSRGAFNRYNGIRVTAAGEGSGTVETVLSANSMNFWGSAHGGLVYAMCDVAAGVAVMGLSAGGVTQSGSLYYLRPAVGSKLRAAIGEPAGAASGAAKPAAPRASAPAKK